MDKLSPSLRRTVEHYRDAGCAGELVDIIDQLAPKPVDLTEYIGKLVRTPWGKGYVLAISKVYPTDLVVELEVGSLYIVQPCHKAWVSDLHIRLLRLEPRKCPRRSVIVEILDKNFTFKDGFYTL